MRYLSQSPEETKAIAAKILPGLTTNVIALHGPLGAGKTTFTQGIAQSLGVTQRVLSPTFILMRQYQVNHPSYNSIYHLDLYRVDSAADLKSIELQEIVNDPQNLVVIEWAEKAKAVLPRKRLDVSFTIGKENQRSLTISHKQ